MDRHTLVHAYMKSSAPLGRSLLSHFLVFDSIACACLFPMENISTYCRPLSTVCTDRQTDRCSICKPEFLRCLQCPSCHSDTKPCLVCVTKRGYNIPLIPSEHLLISGSLLWKKFNDAVNLFNETFFNGSTCT